MNASALIRVCGLDTPDGDLIRNNLGLIRHLHIDRRRALYSYTGLDNSTTSTMYLAGDPVQLKA